MNIFKDFFEFLRDKAYSSPTKISVLVFGVLILLFISDIYGISFYYSNHLKINQLKAIAELKKNYTNDPKHLSELEQLENKIFGRQSLSRKFINFFYTEKPVTERIEQPAGGEEITPADKPAVETPSLAYSQPWLTLSASFIFIIILIAIIFGVFSEKNKLEPGLAFGIFVAFILNIFLIWLAQYLAGFIPIFYSPWVNYAAYVAFWIFVIALIATTAKETKPSP